MIKSVSVKDFKVVAHLETSALMQNHPRGLLFSQSKPTVIVGPNGAGKTALLTALAMQTLSYYTGQSNFDNNYINSSKSDRFWSKSRSWPCDYTFLEGLICKSDLAPALYYRPGHIPGNEKCITTAMMCGYFDEAKAHARMVDKKSSGQQSQALLDKLQHLMSSDKPELDYQHIHWSFGRECREIDYRASDLDKMAEVLKKSYSKRVVGVKPVILMDEPEQSLDAKAQALLWRQIAATDASKVQIIVATHSLYPLMHPKSFKLIEAVPGYIKQVQQLM